MENPTATYSFKLTNRADIACTVALLPGLFSSLEHAVRSGKDIDAFLSDPVTMISTTSGLSELTVEETTPRIGAQSFHRYCVTNPSRVTRLSIQTDDEENLNATITLENTLPHMLAGDKSIYLNDYIEINSILKNKLNADLTMKGDDFAIDDQMLVTINIRANSYMIIGLYMEPLHNGVRQDHN